MPTLRHKRYEKACFQFPAIIDDATEITMQQFQRLTSGIDFTKQKQTENVSGFAPVFRMINPIGDSYFCRLHNSSHYERYYDCQGNSFFMRR